ncbi:hypothetical protein [Streptomyces sp. GC420]|uniref:hypothetical protein n=1 Tax=Streptomyces sp. GC420 TaxID=2697568 RepID=UPI001414E223|nr:hypothetical protein [Streptomyces sp. GC420]NBM19099.1 hypothetical protein [Streptomyces sp. GC420]
MLNVPTQEATAQVSTGPVDVEQAEAALVEHYPRLVRIAYLVLPPGLGQSRRVLTAHSVVQHALPRNRVPEQRTGGDPGYACVRTRVLRGALGAGRPPRRWALPRRAQLPPLLPQVWGLRLFPRSGGSDELVLDQRLSGLSAPARAAWVLRGLERLGDAEVQRVLAAAGVQDIEEALAEADEVRAQYALLESPEFDPCLLQARPPDLMRRRQHTRAAAVAVAALVVCGVLLGLPGEGWGPDGAAAPPYARNPAAEQALDPANLVKAEPRAWKTSARTDFSAWPARGDRVDDERLLRRALAVWARPGGTVQVSATPGTPSGPPAGPAQLLYAGEVDQAAVVLLHDGFRLVRYAEARDGGTAGAALDFARVDGADTATANAVVAGRADGNVRYLTAPWVRGVAVRNLLKPAERAQPLSRRGDGVTGITASPAVGSGCPHWNVLQLRDDTGTRLMTDLGEITPARLTSGPPSAPHDVTDRAGLAAWSRTACLLPSMRANGVRSVNSWAYARQTLPEGDGVARWLCTRADTWRGTGSRVLAQVQAPAESPVAPGAVAARAEDSPACGPRSPQVLAGVLWKSRAGRWYVLAAGSRQIASISTSGGVTGTGRGPVLALPAREGAHAELNAVLSDGTELSALG